MKLLGDCSVGGCDDCTVHHCNVCGEYGEEGQRPFLSRRPVVRISRVVFSIPCHCDRVLIGGLFIYSTAISPCLSLVNGDAYLSRCHLVF